MTVHSRFTVKPWSNTLSFATAGLPTGFLAAGSRVSFSCEAGQPRDRVRGPPWTQRSQRGRKLPAVKGLQGSHLETATHALTPPDSAWLPLSGHNAVQVSQGRVGLTAMVLVSGQP